MLRLRPLQKVLQGRNGERELASEVLSGELPVDVRPNSSPGNEFRFSITNNIRDDDCVS